MSGKILARMSALSLAIFLAACGGEDGSTPIVNVNTNPETPPTDTGSTPGADQGTDDNTDGSDSSGDTGDTVEPETFRIGYVTDIEDPTTFVANGVRSSTPSPLIGGAAAQLQVAILNSDNDEFAAGTENTVTFFSACASSGWSSFTPASITPETGIAYAEYLPTDKCVGQDVIYARINDDFSNLAKITLTNTSSGATNPSANRVGSFDSAGAFTEGLIDASSPALTVGLGGASSTNLKLAIVDTADQPVAGTGYQVNFVSMCLDAGLASVTTSGTTSSGEILAKYNASPECLGTDTVYAFVGDNNELKASVDLTITENNLTIGSFDSAGQFTPSLAASESNLDYNLEDAPATDIRTVVGTIDSSGNFTKLTGLESTLEFFSTCLDSGLSNISSSGSTQSGELISTYTADECIGDDTVYARIAGTNNTASTTISITPKQGQRLKLGYFDAGTFNADEIGNTRSTALPLGVQTKLYLSIADAVTETQVKGQPLTVQFTSQCGEQTGATSPLSTNSASVSLGYIEVLYTAQSCGSLTEDLVRAELTGAEGFTATAEATINLAELPANSLTAGLPTPNSIAPAWYSTDGRETTSTLRVQLKDSQDNGVDGEIVTFTLDNPGAVNVAVLEPVNGGETDNNGFAEVKIKALDGFDNVVFRVVASYTDTSGNLLEAYSAPIAVNSKLPFEERFSISTSNFTPDTQGRNGVQVQLTLLAADDEGNRIRGNTVVNFATNKGSIDPECVLDNEGRCNITWESLDINSPRDVASYGETIEESKKATVTAYTHGRLADGTTGRIETTVDMLMSTSDAIKVELTPATMPAGGGAFCAESWVEIFSDGTKNSPPSGTEITFEVQGGKLLPASSSNFVLGSSSDLLDTPYTFKACTFVELDPTSTDPLRLSVTAAPPNGQAAFDRAD